MLFDFQIPLEILSEDKIVLEVCPCFARSLAPACPCLDSFSAGVLITIIILIIWWKISLR